MIVPDLFDEGDMLTAPQIVDVWDLPDETICDHEEPPEGDYTVELDDLISGVETMLKTAAGAVSSRTDKYTHPTEGWTLRGDAAASYLRMRKAGMPSGGVAVFSRTLAKQAELYRRYKLGVGPVAAYPNARAPHIMAIALDLVTSVGGSFRPSAAFRWLMVGGPSGSQPPRNIPGEKLRAHTYGWRRTVPSERWHFGYDPARDTKAAADLKARLLNAGFKTTADYQRARGLEADGKAGPITWATLLREPTRKPDPAPKPQPKEDDMPTPKDLWTWDGIPAPEGYDPKENPNWTPASLLRSIQLYSRRAARDSAAALSIVKEMAAAGRSLSIAEIDAAALVGVQSAIAIEEAEDETPDQPTDGPG